MPHLVEPIHNVSPHECSTRLEACLEYLVAAGAEAAKRAVTVKISSEWGLRMKRISVELARDGAPPDIGHAGKEHSLAEVINQTANIRRMLDVLLWIRSDESGLKNHLVGVCHPSTSSGPKDDPETDLELSHHGVKSAKFEVTDVVGNKDGNNKEATDLKKLGFINEITKTANKPLSEVPKHRGFLVVSEELGKVMTGKKRWWRSDYPPVVRYELQESGSSTLIFEVFSVSGDSS